MSGETYECPSCGSPVEEDARECPKCGEIFDASMLQVEEAGGPPDKAFRRGRIPFYIGVALVLAGGPAIAFGSFLHDILRIPIGGAAYEVFGWFNRYVAAIGLVVLVVGIVLLILSMRLGPKEFEEDYDVGSPRNT